MDSSQKKPVNKQKRQAREILGTHEKPYIIATGGFGMAQYKVVATPGLEKISGVPDAMVLGAMGKLMAAPIIGNFDKGVTRMLCMVEIIKSLPDNARIYCETTGTGHRFYRAKFRRKDPVTGRSQLVSHYLGTQDSEVLRWMAAYMYEEELLSNFGLQDQSPESQKPRKTMILDRPIKHT